MKLNDIRVGNFWIMKNGIIRSFKLKDFNSPFLEQSLDDKSILPIKLSENWLLELGFEETAEGSKTYFMDDFSNFRNIIRIKKHPTLNGFMFVARDFILCTLEHVHELQNLYYALTTNELKREEKIKEKDLQNEPSSNDKS